MRNYFILFCFLIVGGLGFLNAQKTVKVLHTFKGEGTIGTSSIVMQLNLQSNGVLKGFYSTKSVNSPTTSFLQGNSPIGESQQSTVYIYENNLEKGYLVIPYDIEELEILIGKWYSLDGLKSEDLYVKRIR